MKNQKIEMVKIMSPVVQELKNKEKEFIKEIQKPKIINLSPDKKIRLYLKEAIDHNKPEKILGVLDIYQKTLDLQNMLLKYVHFSN
ncbi:hypothetical protein J7J90_03400 [Candidatus Micrarchaeota archaeon]|nr:hypothetical protein [Candidatus Micrarchaeota archaeon]